MGDEDCFEGLYHYLKVLGEGSFGKAVLYRRYTDNFLVVWKEVKLKSDKEIAAAQHEVDVLSLLSHRNIIGYYNNYVDLDVMYIEMEYANGGTLSQLISQQEQSFTEMDVVWYFWQLCCACVYLHEHGIIHRDIKTQNIFLNKTGILKLGDFGISKMLGSEGDAANSVVGTPYYMSPEICRGLTYGFKSDVWSCGCILYEMLMLEKTFDATNQLRLVYSIVTKEAKPVSESWSLELRNILTSMLQKDPDNRPSTKEILATPYMEQHGGRIEGKLGPANYVRGLSQLTQGVQPMLTDICSEVYIWGGGKSAPTTLDLFKKERGALKVCAGPKHFCVVTVEKELYTWSSGQPGDIVGQLGHGDTASYRAPKQVVPLLGRGVVTAVAGDDFTICILEEGQLVAFGSNYDGCLGIGEDQDNSLVPYDISFFIDMKVTSLSCGENHVMAVTVEGHLYGWGNGEYGCLGNDCEDVVYSPQRLTVRGTKALKVACGKHCSFLITDAGKLMATGDNHDNKLGINKIGKQGTKVGKCEETFVFKPVYGLASVAVREVACGLDHSAVIDAYDRLWTMGSNKCGQRGLGHYKPFSHPTIVKASLSGKKIASVSAGDRFTVATTTSNEIFSWGYRNHGRLGDGLHAPSKATNSSKNSTCTPHAIFSTLHYIPAISSRYWYTLIIAEQVLSAQLIGSGEASCSRQVSENAEGPTPTWLHNELMFEASNESGSSGSGNYKDGKMFHNEISLQSPLVKRAMLKQSYDKSSSGVSTDSVASSALGSELGSPSPVLHKEFSFSKAPCDDSGAGMGSPNVSSGETPIAADVVDPIALVNQSPGSGNVIVAELIKINSELKVRISQLELEVSTANNRTKEKDLIIKDLEARLLDFQLRDLKEVM